MTSSDASTIATQLRPFTEAQLREELDRRVRARDAGLCDVCGKPAASQPCTFPDRHLSGRVGLMPIMGTTNEDGSPV